MGHNSTTRLLDAFEDVLDAERQIILNGDLDAIGRIAKRKERLLDNPALQAATREGLDRIRTKARRNGRLLLAAIDGVRDANARLAAIKEGPGPLNTYDRKGHRRSLGQQTGSGSLERKA